MSEREFDVILFGATGFTGRQTVEYFRQHAPEGLRWAIGGCKCEKLQALGQGCPFVSLTRLIAAGAGPGRSDTSAADHSRAIFELYGDHLVEACVRARGGLWLSPVSRSSP